MSDPETPTSPVDEAPIDPPVDPAPVKKTTKRRPPKTKKAVDSTEVQGERAELAHPALEDPSIEDLIAPESFVNVEDPILVLNPNPNPVTATMHGQEINGYCRAVVSSQDPVARRAIDGGLLLVPSE